MGICWQSFRMGMALGLTGKPLPLAKKEPVAYLYNGARLPKLPEWEIEGFPYITLANEGDSDFPRYGLCVFYSSIPLVNASYETSSGDIDSLIVAQAPTVICSSYWSVGNWVDITEQNCDDPSGVVDGFYHVSGIPSVVWSNYDVYDTEGNLLVSPSEPIPVYE